MAAYWVARVTVNDECAYKKYTELAPLAFNKFEAKFLARGEKNFFLEGDDGFTRSVIIELKNIDQAIACYNSPEYQHASTFRKGFAIVDSWIVDGVS